MRGSGGRHGERVGRTTEVRRARDGHREKLRWVVRGEGWGEGAAGGTGRWVRRTTEVRRARDGHRRRYGGRCGERRGEKGGEREQREARGDG